MKVIELADFQSQKEARETREKLAGELGAIYDAISDSYSYGRDQSIRRLIIRDHPTRKGDWLQVVIQIGE